MDFKRWIPTFLAFPVGGFVAIETVGSLDGPASAVAGGLVAGALIGAAQWLALRSRGIGPSWIAVTAVAMAAGAALAAAVTGAGTGLGDLISAGVITGAAIGGAQSALLARGARASATWIAANAVGWSLGWLVTSAVIVDAERGFHVFGSSGALVATALTGLALRQILADPALAPAPRASGPAWA